MMAAPRRKSTSKAPPQASAPSTSQTPTPRPSLAPSVPSSKLKIHPLLEVYEAIISGLIGTLSEDPFRSESIHSYMERVLQCEQDLELALEEVRQHHENTLEIQRLQRQNAELSKLFSKNLTALSEARTLLSSLPESLPATIDSTPPESPPFVPLSSLLDYMDANIDKIPFQEILEYASKISKFTSPPPQWDSTRPQHPGTYVPWPSEDQMRRGRLAQLAVDPLLITATAEGSATQETQDTEPEEQKPRRNPGRRATSVEARRRKMSAGGEPRPVAQTQQTLQERQQRQHEMDFELDLFDPNEES